MPQDVSTVKHCQWYRYNQGTS